MTETQAPETDQPIVATAGRYYRNTRFLISIIILIGMGAWFAYDGYVKYPKQNREIDEIEHKLKTPEAYSRTEVEQLKAALATRERHNDKALLFQRLLGWSLPPLGIALLIWTLYNSRGAYRMSGDTLEVPGHPPVKLSEMKALDRDLWDRKGIAYVDYETSAGTKGRLRLDDFVYDRPPTDEIYDRIKEHFYPNEKDDDEDDEDETIEN